MIERDSFDSDVFEVSCDYCSKDTEVDSGGDWSGMLLKIKSSGWKVRKVGDEWKHMCPECVARHKSWEA
jgi:hypothetical protein